MNNQERIDIFKDTLRTGSNFNQYTHEFKFDEGWVSNPPDRPLKLVYSENTVDTIFNLKGKRVAALNFADGYNPGGLVWQGVKTQEEDLCRCSNLYQSLEKIEYPIEGCGIYSKSVIFFKDSEYRLCMPAVCDIISVPAPYSSSIVPEIKKRMRMIINVAKIERRDYLIYGRWGCGAFCGDWEVYKKCWEEVCKECGCKMIKVKKKRHKLINLKTEPEDLGVVKDGVVHVGEWDIDEVREYEERLDCKSNSASFKIDGCVIY